MNSLMSLPVSQTPICFLSCLAYSPSALLWLTRPHMVGPAPSSDPALSLSPGAMSFSAPEARPSLPCRWVSAGAGPPTWNVLPGRYWTDSSHSWVSNPAPWPQSKRAPSRDPQDHLNPSSLLRSTDYHQTLLVFLYCRLPLEQQLHENQGLVWVAHCVENRT